MVRFELLQSVFVGFIEVKVREPCLLEQTASLFQLIQVRDPVGRVVARDHFDLPVVAVNHQAHNKIHNPRSSAKTLRYEKALR
jgi:hypothetical protein